MVKMAARAELRPAILETISMPQTTTLPNLAPYQKVLHIFDLWMFILLIVFIFTIF